MKKRKITSGMLSIKTGLARNTVIRLMHADNLGKVSLRTLVKFAISLDCKVKDLFDFKND